MIKQITSFVVVVLIATTKSSKYFAGLGMYAGTFSEAKAFCQSAGTTLASVHSQTDQDAILKLCSETAESVSSNPGNCWFGLTGYPTFSWVDGSATDYGFNGNSGNSPTYANPPWQSNLRDSKYPCTMIWYGKWWNPKADCNWQGIPICNAAGTSAVTVFSVTHNLGFGADRYNHFRQCEGTTSTYGCATGVLRFGACWYGSPADDPGYPLCPHPANGHCTPVTGNCVNLFSKCNGQKSCSVTVNNAGMGGDPCPGVYKFGAVAYQCVATGAQAEPADMIDDGGISESIGAEVGDYKDGYQVYRPGFDEGGYDDNGGNNYIFQFSSQSMVYAIGGIICLLLMVNILCLCYHNCRCGKTPKYTKVVQYASSDDGTQNLKESKI